MMDGEQLLERFDLDDDRLLDQQVDSVGGLELDRSVDQWKGPLALRSQTSISQLEGKTGFVG